MNDDPDRSKVARFYALAEATGKTIRERWKFHAIGNHARNGVNPPVHSWI